MHYRFTLPQIEAGIEQPTEEVHELCMDLVSRAVRNEEYLHRLALPNASGTSSAVPGPAVNPICTVAWTSPTTAKRPPSCSS